MSQPEGDQDEKPPREAPQEARRGDPTSGTIAQHVPAMLAAAKAKQDAEAKDGDQAPDKKNGDDKPPDGAKPDATKQKDDAKPDDAKQKADAKPPPWKPGAHSVGVIIAFTLIALIGVLVVLWAWQLWPFATAVQSTEDAYVQGHTTVISPQVSGYLARVPVEDFALVKPGQVLAIIDQSTYRQSVAQARAEVDARLADLANNRQTLAERRATVVSRDAGIQSARANYFRALAEMRRTDDLVRDGSVSEREAESNRAAFLEAGAMIEQARAQREIAVQQVRSAQVNEGALRANVEAAQAQLDSALIDLGHTVIRAPQAGQLSEVGARIGQYVTSGSQLLFLVPGERWVTANFKERETRHMTPGQPAWFTVDGLAGARIEGRVERMAPATGSEFSVLRPDNASGNFTKVPQRIQVRVRIGPDQPIARRLRPGMSVEMHVDTTGGPSDDPDDYPARTVTKRTVTQTSTPAAKVP